MTTVIVEYVWCSGGNTHHDLRSKCRTLVDVQVDYKLLKPEDLPVWNFDGSSTNQAKGKDTEILIKPVAIFPHPFIQDFPALVTLCECYLPNGQPTPDNTRRIAASVFQHPSAAGLDPWFGMEQEYVLIKNERPYGWPENGEPPAQGPYYCSTGPMWAKGRQFTTAHYKKCLQMGLKISGTNAEVMPGQWEYQVGICSALEAGDHLLMSRWVYLRVLEETGDATMDVNFEVKPKKGDWNGSGLHTNFSTAKTRAPGGIEEIKAILERLKTSFFKDIVFYSSDNNQRMTGKHETSKLDEFTSGIGTRGTSIRIPNQVNQEGKGYMEDRRPGADADPYLVSARLFASAYDIPAPQLDKLETQLIKPWMAEIQRAASPLPE